MNNQGKKPKISVTANSAAAAEHNSSEMQSRNLGSVRESNMESDDEDLH